MRTFKKNLSVFKDWREDNPGVLKRCFDIDMAFSKILKFVRDQEVYEQVCEVLFKYLPRLKEIFTHCIGISSYPSISWLEFTDLCIKWKIPRKYQNSSKATNHFN